MLGRRPTIEVKMVGVGPVCPAAGHRHRLARMLEFTAEQWASIQVMKETWAFVAGVSVEKIIVLDERDFSEVTVGTVGELPDAAAGGTVRLIMALKRRTAEPVAVEVDAA